MGAFPGLESHQPSALRSEFGAHSVVHPDLGSTKCLGGGKGPPRACRPQRPGSICTAQLLPGMSETHSLRFGENPAESRNNAAVEKRPWGSGGGGGGREARPACGGGERGGPESAHVNRPTSQSLAATRGAGAVQAGNRTLTADGAGAAGALLGVEVAEAAQAVGELVAGREALAGQRLLAGGAHEALAVPGLLPVRDAPAGDGLRAEGRQLPQGPVPGALVPALASGGHAVLAQDTPHRRPGPRGNVLRTARSPHCPFPKLPGPRCRPRIPVRDVGTGVSAGTALPPGRQESEAGRPQLRGQGLMSRSPSSAPPAGRSL